MKTVSDILYSRVLTTGIEWPFVQNIICTSQTRIWCLQEKAIHAQKGTLFCTLSIRHFEVRMKFEFSFQHHPHGQPKENLAHIFLGTNRRVVLEIQTSGQDICTKWPKFILRVKGITRSAILTFERHLLKINNVSFPHIQSWDMQQSCCLHLASSCKHPNLSSSSACTVHAIGCIPVFFWYMTRVWH